MQNPAYSYQLTLFIHFISARDEKKKENTLNRVASNRPLPLLRCLPSPLLTISSSDIKRHVTIYTKGYKIRVLFVLAFFILFSLALSFFLLHFDAVVCLPVCAVWQNCYVFGVPSKYKSLNTIFIH